MSRFKGMVPGPHWTRGAILDFPLEWAIIFSSLGLGFDHGAKAGLGGSEPTGSSWAQRKLHRVSRSMGSSTAATKASTRYGGGFAIIIRSIVFPMLHKKSTPISTKSCTCLEPGRDECNFWLQNLGGQRRLSSTSLNGSVQAKTCVLTIFVNGQKETLP